MKTFVIGVLVGVLLLYLSIQVGTGRGDPKANNCSGPRPMSGLAGQGSCWWQRDQDNRLRDVENDMRRFNGTMPR